VIREGSAGRRCRRGLLEPKEHAVPNLRRRVNEEQGFTLIELLVVVLVIGILAAIVIPAFLNQTGKAQDASAKELAHTAQVAAETYATDHNGSYASLTPAALQSEEASIVIASGTSNAYVVSATGTATGYAITVAPARPSETFTVTRAGGTVTRTCTPSSGAHGGCLNGTW